MKVWHSFSTDFSYRTHIATIAETECGHSCLCQQTIYRNEIPKKYCSSHLWYLNKFTARTTYGKKQFGSKPHSVKLYSFCVSNPLCVTLVDVIQIYGNSNEWMEHSKAIHEQKILFPNDCSTTQSISLPYKQWWRRKKRLVTHTGVGNMWVMCQ